jgi:hypothetical protein
MEGISSVLDLSQDVLQPKKIKRIKKKKQSIAKNLVSNKIFKTCVTPVLNKKHL